MKHCYTRLAERDFADIANHIARDDVGVAFAFQAELERFVESIAENPAIYRARAEWGGVRAARLKGYLIIYEIAGDLVTVLRIVSGRRDIARLLRGEAS